MDMELQRMTIEGYRCISQGMFTQEETLESIVPDACPDISRIVSAVGKVFLKDKEPGEGSMRLSGTAKVTVLYIPEGEGAPRSLEVAIPFQCVRDNALQGLLLGKHPLTDEAVSLDRHALQLHIHRRPLLVSYSMTTI